MTDRGTLLPVPDPDYDIVLRAYMQLPLFRRQEDGGWVVPLRTFDACELRLVERVPAVAGDPVLWVELFDPRIKSVVESRLCEELEDAVTAFKTLLPLAAAYSAILHPVNSPNVSSQPQGSEEHD